MASARTTTARGVKPRPATGATNRLDLLEALLMSRDAGQCAQRALAWLQRNAGVRRGLCLAADTAPPRLVPVASLGVAAGALQRRPRDPRSSPDTGIALQHADRPRH